MSDWLHSLPVVWMALLVFGLTYLITAVIWVVVIVLAVGERARSFKAVSPGLLPPLGIIFGLFVAFTAAQVWTDNEKAKAEIVQLEADKTETDDRAWKFFAYVAIGGLIVIPAVITSILLIRWKRAPLELLET
jgi:hypothetical protein